MKIYKKTVDIGSHKCYNTIVPRENRKEVIIMEKTNKTTVKTIGFSGLLTIAFIVLKLCGVIAWSWLWVLAPLWIAFLLKLVIVLIIMVVALIADHY